MDEVIKQNNDRRREGKFRAQEKVKGKELT